MNYYSTRNHQHIVSAAQAIACGLAPDGGLFVPEALPGVSAQQLQALCGMTYQQRAVTIMRPFLSEFTDDELNRFTAVAYGSQFDDPAVAPVHRLDDATAFLELWHGPTCAFKDMALQILPYLLTASLKKCGEQRQGCRLVPPQATPARLPCRALPTCRARRSSCFIPTAACRRSSACRWSRRPAAMSRSARCAATLTMRRPASSRSSATRRLRCALAARLVPVLGQLHQLGPPAAADRLLFLGVLRRRYRRHDRHGRQAQLRRADRQLR